MQHNIVLIGMPASGKSSLGKRLARLLGLDFVDTDAVVEARSGKSISTLFAEEGEAVFREWERQAVAEVAQRQGLVIATGGGVVLSEENMRVLGASGLIVHVKRHPSICLRHTKPMQAKPMQAKSGQGQGHRMQALTQGHRSGQSAQQIKPQVAEEVNQTALTAGRPLLQEGDAALWRLYAARLPLYCRYAEYTVWNERRYKPVLLRIRNAYHKEFTHGCSCTERRKSQ